MRLFFNLQITGMVTMLAGSEHGNTAVINCNSVVAEEFN
jgi:hypothetical protein